MAFLRPSAAKQTSVTTGTGTLALTANAGDTRSLQAVLGSGPTRCRGMLRGNGYFEMFRGTYTAPATLTRDEVIISSNSDNLVSIPPGTTDVYLLDYAHFQTERFSSAKVLTNKDASNSWIFTGASATDITLPAISATLPDFWGFVKNVGTATLSLKGAGADTVDESGTGTVLIQPTQSAFVFLDYNANSSPVWRVKRGGARPKNIYTNSAGISPSNTTSATKVHAGIGSSVALTPRSTGRVRLTVEGWCSNATAGASMLLNLNCATGAAPANGATPGSNYMRSTDVNVLHNSAGGDPKPFHLVGEMSGLAIGTAIWGDLSFAVSAGSGIMRITQVIFEEIE